MLRLVLIILFALHWIPFQIYAQSVVNTAHNLSINGPGTVTATSEQQVCIFCHTPHNSNPQAPLWNKSNPGQTYTMYDNSVSSTSDIPASSTQPDGSSILCLSCHDGTIALGSVAGTVTDIFDGSGGTMPVGRGLLSIDLSDDHPISFIYSTVASADGQFHDPPLFPVTLDGSGKVQCATCHNAHDNINGKFLVSSNEFSDLCLDCHINSDWATTSHSTSTATWNSTLPNPWGHIGAAIAPSTSPPYAQVDQNACSNCHDSHADNSGGRPRLLKSALEENNCLDCHNGNVASTDIQTDINKLYSHNVSGYNLIHDPNETTLIGTPHVECQDCHNPHAVNGSTASAPLANGTLANIKGINQSGIEVDPITNQYELCYRCHADNPVTSSPTTRQFGGNNVRLDFATTNNSYHPVVAAGNNPSPRGLIGHTASSVIYCTDCHASSGSTATGPHGSIYPRILKANYNLNATTGLANHSDATLTTEYALCAQCHNMTDVNTIHSGMKGGHFLAYTTCNTCHDPHGFSGGTPANNNFLINLIADDVNYLGPARVQGTWYDPVIALDQGSGGTCTFTCHAKSHSHGGSNYTK